MPELPFAAYPDAGILVVDDNPSNVLLLRKLLARAGYRNVQWTLDPVEAEGMALEQRPDLVILDLHMPGMSGFELLSRLRSQRGPTEYLPILVFSADVTSDARQRALELGASDFLTKPGSPIETMLRVRNFLETRYLHRAVEDQNDRLQEMVRLRTQSLEAAHLEIVHRLALAGEFRDDDTGDHCRRVGELSSQIALAYGLSIAEADLICRAAPLHDIGKVAVSDGILRKPGKLTEEEFDEVRTHVAVGAGILADSECDILRMAHDIALTHHERWDGRGYGRGLMGEEIPLCGRIVAVADVFDALTNLRPYKRIWPVQDAILEIARSSGTHFDPAVVAAFLRVMGVEALPLAA